MSITAKVQRFLRMLSIVFAGVLCPAWSYAQGKSIELTGAYSVAQVGEEQYPVGWMADVALPLYRQLWFLGEGSGVYDSADAVHGELRTITDNSLFAAAVGLRWYAAREHRIWPFVQVLVGPVWAKTSRKFEPLSGPVPSQFLEPFDHTEPGAAVQVGLGANIRLTRRLATRIAVQYRLMGFENVELGTTALTFTGGIVFLLGGQ